MESGQSILSLARGRKSEWTDTGRTEEKLRKSKECATDFELPSETTIPLFSVAVPLYNKAQYVGRTIESILGQSYQGFEVVVVDDGSVDGSAEIVREFRDSRIRVIQQANQGVAAARNRAIEEAKGEFVAFVDADDEWLPSFLAEIAGLIDQYPDCGMYGTGYALRRDDSVDEIVRNRFKSEKWKGIVANYFHNLEKRNIIVCSSAVAIRRSTVLGKALFPVGESLGEDQYAWATIALKHQVAYTQEVLAIYHRDAISSFESLGVPKSPVCFVPLLRKVIETGEFEGKAISTDVRRSLERYLAESLIQLSARNARVGDFATALGLVRGRDARRKPFRLLLVIGFILTKYVRSTLKFCYLKTSSRSR